MVWQARSVWAWFVGMRLGMAGEECLGELWSVLAIYGSLGKVVRASCVEELRGMAGVVCRGRQCLFRYGLLRNQSTATN